MAQGSQTADRAIGLLLLSVERDEPLALADLSRLSGLNKAATYRLVQSLLKHDLLAREPNGRRYVVGGGLVAMAASVMRRVSIRSAARPVMERIAAATNETVSLHVRHLRHRICVEALESAQPIRRVVPLGETLPLYSGPSGKAILAFLSEGEADEVLAWAAEEGEDVGRIAAQLRFVREHGYLGAVGDRTVGVGGLSAPVFDAAAVAGTITVSGPGDRFDTAAINAAAAYVAGECAALSLSLGHGGPMMESSLTRSN